MSEAKIIYLGGARGYTREEMQSVFAHFARDDAIMVVLRQILAERLAVACVDNTEPKLSEREAGMVAGRMAELSALQGELEEFHKNTAALRRNGAITKEKGGK